MDLSQMYQKDGAPAAKPATSPEPEKPMVKANIEAPPGLPQEYIDMNLRDQPLPDVVDIATIEGQDIRPLSFRKTSRESLCNATSVPYNPGRESKAVRDRIEQGPRVFVSYTEKVKFDLGLGEKDEEKERPKGPTIAHPDTLRPGTFIKGDSPAYRPG